MQTTLLGIGFAVILALVTALLGPLFIDWENYRSAIETEAGRLAGTPVRITGPIELRLLPTPSVKLANVQLRPGGSIQPVTARRMEMEFALATLLRGEVRASEVTIEGAELSVGLDRYGNLQMPFSTLGFDPDRLAIERLTIADSRVRLADAASGTSLVVGNVNLSGEVRSLLGPFRADGTFAADGQQYAFRLSGSHRGDDGGMKLRFAVDSAERAIAFESEGELWIEARAPRYEGAVTLSRVVGTTAPDGRPTINEPWKVTGKVKAAAAKAEVEQLDLQYGPEVRSIRLAGSGVMDFGSAPRIAGKVTVRQIDVDRVFGRPEQKQLPLEAIKSLAERLAALAPPRLQMRVGVGIDSLLVGGSNVTAIRADVERVADGWNVESLELRAPGATVMHVAGKLATAERNLAFAGPVRIDSSDPAVFSAWLEGRSAAGKPALGPMRGAGSVTLGSDRIAVEDLRAEVDRKPVEGRLSYRFATAAAPARLDAALNAPELDLDRAVAIGNAIFASTGFDRPGEVALALDTAHAVYAGVEARKAHAVLAFDSSGLKIEGLSIADFGGAALEASGRIDSVGDAARGSIAMSLSAPRLDGIAALAEKFFPEAADQMRKYGARLSPVRLSAKLDVAPRRGGAAEARTAANVRLNGKIAGMDLDLRASGTGDIAELTLAARRIEGRLEGPEARTLAAFLGLDALVNADARPAAATFLIDGAAEANIATLKWVPESATVVLDRDAEHAFKVDGRFAGSDVNAAATGTLSLAGDGTLDVVLRAADTRLPRRDPAAAVPVDLRTRLAVDADTVRLSDLAGKVAGSDVKGQLVLGLGEPMQVNGRLETGELNGGELIGLLTGTPRTTAAHAAPAWWPSEPFGQAMIPAMDGRIEFRASTVRWPAGLATRSLAGTVHFEPSGFSLTDVTGMLADGRLALDAKVQREPMGISLSSRVRLANADLPVLFASVLRVPAAGRVTVEADVHGQGLSAASLMGALNGTGRVTTENLEMAGLDPSAVEKAARALDRDIGLAANPARLADIVNAGLSAGKLTMPAATAEYAVVDGRSLLKLAAQARDADIAGSVSFGLADGQMDVGLTMTGPQRQNALAGERPQMAVAVRGPIAAPRRSADVGPLVKWAAMQVEKTRRGIETATEALRRQSDAMNAGEQAAVAQPSDPVLTSGRVGDLPGAADGRPTLSTVRRQAPPPAPRPLNLMDLQQDRAR